MNKTDKPIVRLGKTERTQIINIDNKKGNITTDPMEITKLIKKNTL